MTSQSEHIYWVLEAQIADGRRDDLVAIMEKMVASTQAREPGALAYEWWISADGTRVFIYERYVDSDAALTHLGNVGPLLGEMLALVTIAPLKILGPASAALRAAGASFGASFAERLGGFAR